MSYTKENNMTMINVDNIHELPNNYPNDFIEFCNENNLKFPKLPNSKTANHFTFLFIFVGGHNFRHGPRLERNAPRAAPQKGPALAKRLPAKFEKMKMTKFVGFENFVFNFCFQIFNICFRKAEQIVILQLPPTSSNCR